MYIGHMHDETENKKEKFNGRKIRTTLPNRSVREIPFGIDKKRWFARAKNPEDQMKFAILLFCTK
jgi:hypothetical protein